MGLAVALPCSRGGSRLAIALAVAGVLAVVTLVVAALVVAAMVVAALVVVALETTRTKTPF